MNAYNQMGVILTRQDKYEPAKKYPGNALELGNSLPDSNSLTLATTSISLGVVNAAEKNRMSLSTTILGHWHKTKTIGRISC